MIEDHWKVVKSQLISIAQAGASYFTVVPICRWTGITNKEELPKYAIAVRVIADTDQFPDFDRVRVVKGTSAVSTKFGWSIENASRVGQGGWALIPLETTDTDKEIYVQWMDYVTGTANFVCLVCLVEIPNAVGEN